MNPVDRNKEHRVPKCISHRAAKMLHLAHYKTNDTNVSVANRERLNST